jgi:hypothetical protein
MRTLLTDSQLKFIYAQSDKMTAREIGNSVGLKPCAVSSACRKMGVIPLRHSPKPRFNANYLERPMTPEEQAELGLNGYFAYKGFRVRPGPTTMERIGNKGRPTIQYWTARHDRGTPTKNAGTIEKLRAWIDEQTRE